MRNKDFVNPVSQTYLVNTSQSLQEATKNYDLNYDVPVTYDINTNKYTYSFNGGSVDLYSTADICDYYFGSNLQKKDVKDKIYIVGLADGVDMITYEGVVIGYGANTNTAQTAFSDYMHTADPDAVRKAVESAEGGIVSGAITSAISLQNETAGNGAAGALAYVLCYYHLNNSSNGYADTNYINSAEFANALAALEGMDYYCPNSAAGGAVLGKYINIFDREATKYFYLHVASNTIDGNFDVTLNIDTLIPFSLQ